jgi:DHA1 family inner membrane transport protein
MDRRLLVLTLGMFAIGTDSFVVAGILPNVAQSLDTSVSLAGQMVTVYALSFALLAPIMAAVAGGWPRKKLLVVALCVFVVGNAITAIAPDLNTVLASRVIAGLGAAMFSPTALAAAASLVAPERRGRALSTVTAGLAGATALGAPTGAFIGELAGWRGTLWFVSALGLVAAIGVWSMLRTIPQPPRITLRERIAPLHDARIALTLLTTLFAFGGLLMVYTYIGVTFDRVTHNASGVLAGMLFVWGIAATVGNLLSGRLVDRFDSRRIINAALIVASINFAALPWTSAYTATSLIALVVWGFCGWGLLVPQQHRLVTIAPHVAPLSLALNNTATYMGVASAGAIGGLVITFLDVHYLGLIGAASITFALVLAEIAFGRIAYRAAQAPLVPVAPE